MKKKPYFPRIVSQRPEWFSNYATELPGANGELGLPAGDVTDIIADAKYCEYVSGAWLTAVRGFNPTGTAALELLYRGTGPDPVPLPTFTAPALPSGVVAVPPGALKRIFAFVKTIKSRPKYTETIGEQLGIIGEEDEVTETLPTFTISLTRVGPGPEAVRVDFKKFTRPGVVVWSRRGGGDWEMLGIDLESPYVDQRPLLVATQPEVREYRLQFYEDAGPTGEFTAVQSITVSP